MKADSQSAWIDLFNNGINARMFDDKGDECLPVEYQNNYNINNPDERFKITNFELPGAVKNAVKTPDVLETYVPDINGGVKGFSLKAILVGSNNDEKFIVAGQKFSSKKIALKKNKMAFLLSKDTFVKQDNNLIFNFDENISCLFFEDTLNFIKYSEANAVFDISQYYRIASQDEVNDFKSSELIFVSNDAKFEKNFNSAHVRKKLARIKDLGTLNDINVIKENALTVDLELPLTSDGNKLLLPEDSKSLKELLAFLAEEMYPGMFTKTPYMSSSTRKVKE